MQRILPSLKPVIAARSFTSAARVALPRTALLTARSCAARHLGTPVASAPVTRRFLQSGGASKANRDVEYSEMKKLSSQPTEDLLLIDVREPDEVMMGSIPASVNLPLSSLEKAFTMDSSDFMKAYGFRKPDKKMPLIFFCKAGVRSSSAVSLAKGKGYTNARNYPGSYADWLAHEQGSNSSDSD